LCVASGAVAAIWGNPGRRDRRGSCLEEVSR